eukprot:31276-Pelagococcus_subviridis.AAC.1
MIAIDVTTSPTRSSSLRFKGGSVVEIFFPSFRPSPSGPSSSVDRPPRALERSPSTRSDVAVARLIM